jgi:putative phage-type endonuclease
MTQHEQGSKEWYKARTGRITGSTVGAILGLSPWQKPKDILRSMVREYHGAESEFNAQFVADHGKNNEQRALLCFMRETGLMVEQCGFFPYGDRMGASPDGLTSDGGVLELKVPYSLRNGGTFKSIEDQPHYMAQVQMEILSTGRTHAWFGQYIAPKGDPLAPEYVTERLQVERVEADPEWIDRNLPAISAFYELYLMELDNPEHMEPLRVHVDSADAGTLLMEMDAIRKRKKADEVREKEILAELVKLAGEKDASIHGRPLTKVERKGSVQYAKIPELEGVDLEKYRGKPSSFWRFS